MAEIEVKIINELLACPERAILEADEKYRKFIHGIAERVVAGDKIRVVLLAGPSGSGKTTTANMLADRIKELGSSAFVISLDNFYRNCTDPKYPRHADGSRDFEAVDALDIPYIEETLSKIADGEDFSIPLYDFKIACRSQVVNYDKISHGCVIIEGLHALNPQICGGLPEEKTLKIFISVSTNINKEEERILSGRKLRFVRRMVRDSIYRGADAETTLSVWQNVLAGEDKYLYPYRDNADVQYDTFHSFEPGIMRPFVEKLISPELAEKNPYAKTVIEALREVCALDESLLPDDSLIREFVPGGKYEHVY